MQIAGIPVLHPADHDTPSVRCEHRLGSVKINAVISRMVALLHKFAVFFVIGSHKIERAVAVVVFQSTGKHVLCTGQQHIFSVKLKEIGTLPHFSELMIIFHQSLHERPVNSVLTAIEEHLTAVFPVLVGDQHPKASVLFHPELRIPECIRIAPFGKIPSCDHRVSRVLDIIVTVPKCQILSLGFLFFTVLIDDQLAAGIHQHLPSVRQCKCTAGITSVSVIRPVRSHCGGKIGPVDQILADRMSPVHRPPMRIIRVILIKQMILSVIIREAVRIVHPSDSRTEMKGGSISCINKFVFFFLVSPGVS